jgi:hypothetical protein
VKDGDLVFRRGRSLASRIVLTADPVGGYSHVGIVVVRNGAPLVVHASPPEGHEKQGVTHAEPFATFVAPAEASAYAVYRLRPGMERIAGAAALRAAAYERAATPFDSAFDLNSPDKVYCTELVWRSYAEVGIDLVEGRRDHLHLPFFQKDVILPSSISSSKYLFRVADSHQIVEETRENSIRSADSCDGSHRPAGWLRRFPDGPGIDGHALLSERGSWEH